MRRLAAFILLALTIAWLGPPVAAAPAAPSPAYDASGNVVDNGTNLGGFAFTYDFSNQPTAVTIAGAPYPYVYDGDLNRVKHARPGGQTIYTAYSRVSGKPILRYVEPEQSYFDWTEGVGPMEVWFFRGALHSYRHLDAQGSVMADSNAAGGVGFSERYTPFGERLIGTTNHHNPGYTGHMRDGDTGLNYMQARLYDPVIGRFLSTDPIGYQDQLNLYAYVANDPVNKVDPTGEYIESLIDVGFLIADVAAIVDSGFTAGNVAALAGDLAGLALPGATGGGLAARAAVEGAQAAGKAADKAGDAAKAANKTCCFVAGTLVETAQGLKPIEEIKIGDLVLARNVETGETTLKPVADLIRRHERVIWEVALAGPGGETERFETTDDHPWWIAGQGWKTTQELAAGMAVVTKDGRGMVVASATETARTDATYNLTVADFETYFVGEQRVLVHNCPTGSYTNTHESGTKYFGKGDEARAKESGARLAKEHNDPLAKTETQSHATDRESFKQEARNLAADGGPKSDTNYNKIESPGAKYIEEDKIK